MGNFRAYYDHIYSLLGVLFSLSASVVFICKYGNIVAGTWAMFSGVFAAICLLLHILYWTDRLGTYHTPKTLSRLKGLGFTVMVIGLAETVWYIFAFTYWHQTIFPIKDSMMVCAVWSLITAKWGLCLFLISRRYSSILLINYAPIQETI